ncbi:MAG TPA: T9SS type A sorting domain-containing protein, partial [Bacteroidaceae bacterium]|nr:T9SS type A sorting domain-containing protein [Bacteroidaceae bacterium]
VHLIKTDTTGNMHWIRTIGGKKYEYSYSLSLDDQENIYLSGYYESDTLIIESSGTESIEYTNNNGSYDIMIAKYTSSGDLEWFRATGGKGSDKLFDSKFFKNELRVSGHFTDTLRWGGIQLTTKATNDVDMFFGSLDPEGNYRSANRYGGRNNSWEEARDLFYDSDNLYTVMRSNSDLLVLGDSIYTSTTGKFYAVMGVIGCLPIFIDTVYVTDVTGCYGDQTGTISIFASGGFGSPFRYSIDNGLTYQDNNPNFLNLPAGTYPIVVTDKQNCTQAGKVVTIKQPDLLTITEVEKSDPLCFGEYGTVEFEAEGGTPGYEYSINEVDYFSSNIFTDLPAGDYNLTAKDKNGCMSGPVLITVAEAPAELLFEFTVEHPLCSGDPGSIEFTSASGGVPDYLYSINGVDFVSATGFTDLPTGDYTLTILDANGCTATAVDTSVSFTLDELTFEFTIEQTLCYGETGTIEFTSASGGTPGYEYSVNADDYVSSNIFSGLPAGEDFTLSIRDANGCVSESVVATIDGHEELIITVENQQDITNESYGQIEVSGSGGVEPYSYVLQPTGTSQNNGTFIITAGGDYTVELTDGNGCGPVSTPVITIADFTGFHARDMFVVAIYPNPSTGQVTISIQYGEPELNLEILSITGQVVLQKKGFTISGVYSETFDLGHFADGMYLLRVDGQVLNSKLLIE